MIIGGESTAMTSGFQLMAPVPQVRTRCARPPVTGSGIVAERPKRPSPTNSAATNPAAVYRGSLAQRIVALRHELMSSPGGFTSP
jgi:hypothetical protein